ncbi:MAG: molybdopterin-dependent oxidoreductase [Gemmatimonadaceae bacterium]|nr:molybdopterin-dependent oxidoreductase [Gemmatimonadaceae bacterium]
MNRHGLATLRRIITTRVETTAESLQARGALDRRAFVRLMSLGVAAPLVAACSAPGSDQVDRVLKTVGQGNERLERWLLRQANRTDRVPRGVMVAGDAFPSYFISDQVPTWNAMMRGAWTLEVTGAVKTPLRLTYDQVRGMATQTQRVHHYCVEGWSAAVEFQGVPFRTLAALAQPTADAGYVDFASFDSDYHESWDVESAMHPQTLVVVAKDGKALSPAYGAPARIHSPIKLGYKNTKYLTRITFMPAPNGGYWSDEGYEWFGGT